MRISIDAVLLLWVSVKPSPSNKAEIMLWALQASRLLCSKNASSIGKAPEQWTADIDMSADT